MVLTSTASMSIRTSSSHESTSRCPCANSATASQQNCECLFIPAILPSESPRDISCSLRAVGSGRTLLEGRGTRAKAGARPPWSCEHHPVFLPLRNTRSPPGGHQENKEMMYGLVCPECRFMIPAGVEVTKRNAGHQNKAKWIARTKTNNPLKVGNRRIRSTVPNPQSASRYIRLRIIRL
jgi:hypothetical protein